MKFKSLILPILVFIAYQGNSQKNIEFNDLDSLVEMAISISSQALYEANFSEAKEAVSIEYFENFKNLKNKHRIMLTIQDLRIDRFLNIIHQRKFYPKENFNRLAIFQADISEIKEKEIVANFYRAFSNLHRSLKNIDSSSIYEIKALKLFNESGKLDKVAEIRADQISRKHNRYLREGKKKEILRLIPEYKKEIEISKTYSKYALSYNTRHLAQIYRRQTFDYKQSLRLFKESLSLRKEIGFKPFIPASYSSLGDVYVKLGNFKLAEEMYLKSKNLADEIGFVRYQCNPYISIGDIYLTQKNKLEALEYYSKALKSASLNNYTTGINVAIEKIKSIKN